MRCAAASLAFAVLVSWSHSSRADDAQKAAESFRQAQAAFERHEYAAAAAAFEQAADFEPHPAALIDAADNWELAKEYARAAGDDDRVLAMANLDARFRTAAREQLARLGSRIATLDFEGPGTVVVRIDEGAEFRAPARRRVLPGPHAVTRTSVATGETHRTTLDLAGGESRRIRLEPTPSPIAETRRNGLPFLVAGLAAGASAGIVSLVFGIRTVGSHDDFEAVPTAKTRDAFYRNRLITNVSAGVSIASIVGGVVLWRLVGGSVVRAEPRSDGTGASFAVEGRF